MEILLVGTGYMANEYAKVLIAQNVKFDVVGRSEINCNKFRETFGVNVFSGGLESLKIKKKYTHAIIASSLEYLSQHTAQLINVGIRSILVEKPGALSIDDLHKLNIQANLNSASVFVAYNRRFYSSVSKLRELINIEGGISSIHFEFTEWVHTIDVKDYSEISLQKWILSNSSHVIDIVFFLLGEIKELNSNVSKKEGISWHPSGSIFTGAGQSKNGVPFSYHSNWESAGRWSIEILTKENRYYLRPIEKLQVQKKGTLGIELVEIDNLLDEKYKPGVFNQVKYFLKDNMENFCSLNQQLINASLYSQIANYSV